MPIAERSTQHRQDPLPVSSAGTNSKKKWDPNLLADLGKIHRIRIATLLAADLSASKFFLSLGIQIILMASCTRSSYWQES
jgi:hypothetical protein